MQNNEFEKQVQERMGQIKFTPSEAVWAEVEKNLKEKRKRRIAIFWLLIFFIAAGGSTLGWFYLSPSDNNIANHQSTAGPALKNATEISPVPAETDQSTSSQSDKKEHSKINDNLKTASSAKTSDIETNQAPGTNSNKSQQNNIPAQSSSSHYKHTLPNSSVTTKTTDQSKKRAGNKNPSAAILASGSVGETNVNVDKSNTVVDQPEQGISVNDNKADADSSVKIDSALIITKNKTIDSVATSTSTVKIKTNTKPKWQLSLSAGIGMSDIVYPSSMNKSMDMAVANPPLSNLSAPGNSFQNSALYISPKELNPGIEFSLGVSASKKIKKRLSFAVGLQYHYYSTSISVGPYLDSVSAMNNNRSYLAAGPRVNDQTNKYHFVEIPVTIGFQLLKNKPLHLTSGISLGQLIASDVLTYNSSQRVFISDGSNINKTQLNLLLGLSWTFDEKGRMPIQVGPNFSYGASNLSGKSVSGSNHMYTIGAGAKIMFRKK